MRIVSLASALLAAPLLLALAPRADEITFHPKDDSKLAKKFSVAAELELTDVTITVNDQDASGQVPNELSLGGELSIAIVDHYIKVEDGKPLELVRKFVKSKVDGHSPHDSGSAEDLLKLDGKEMRFKWNGDEKRYDISFVEGDPETVEFGEFWIDMDLRSLLPGKSVSEGDHWNVEGKQLATALLLGLDFEHKPDFGSLFDEANDAEDEAAMQMFEELLPQLVKLRDDCKATCEFAGRRDAGGRRLAVIKIKLDVVNTLDITPFWRVAMIQGAGLEEADIKIDDASLKLTIKGEGELLWDIAAGHAHGFDMTAELEFAAKLLMSFEADGESIEIDGGAELLGKSRWTMELE